MGKKHQQRCLSEEQIVLEKIICSAVPYLKVGMLSIGCGPYEFEAKTLFSHVEGLSIRIELYVC
jgi:hypothetical protein